MPPTAEKADEAVQLVNSESSDFVNGVDLDCVHRLDGVAALRVSTQEGLFQHDFTEMPASAKDNSE